MSYSCIHCGSVYEERLSWCWTCMSSDTLVRLPSRPRSHLAGEPRRASARELAAAAWTMVESAAYPLLRILAGALVIIYGGPGAGKSTMGMKWLNKLEGAVLYVPLEEGLGPATSERCSRLAVRRSDFHMLSGGTVDDLAAEVARVKAKALCIDSVTVSQLLPSEVRQLLEATSLQLLIGTCQVNKAGQAAGVKGWTHEADVVLRIEDGQYELEKSRYQPLGLQGGI